MAQRYQYKRIDLATDAIRLVKLLSGGQDEPIRCEIFETYMHQVESVPYDALSYVWGSRRSANMIWLDGHHFEVTENLEEALVHLRRPNEDRVLWIDAICIDQSHNAERGHQVRQMRLVYQYAERVVIWLGASNCQIDYLFCWMTALDQHVLAVARPHTMSTWESQWCWVTLNVRGQLPPDEIKTALIELLEREWFSRIWVLQEAALAKSAVITCGRNEVNSRAFVTMPSLLGIDCREDQQSRLDILPGLLRAKSWWTCDYSKSLVTLIQKFGRSKASDPRDIIYALLGLSDDAYLSEFLQPDYQMSLQETIQQSVAYLMMQTHDLPKDVHVKTLPKWTLDEFLQFLPDLAFNVFRWALHHAQDGLLYDLFISLKTKQDGQLEQRYMRYSATYAQHVHLNDSVVSRRKVRGTKPKKWLWKNRWSDKYRKPRHMRIGSSANHGPPITIAMTNGNFTLVELLLQCPNVDAQTVDSLGNSPISIAMGQGNTVVANLMLQRMLHNTQGRDRDHYASLWRIQNTKINLPAHMDLRRVEFDTPLLTATKQGDSTAVEEILASNLVEDSIYVVDSNGDGLMNLAARRGDLITLNILLQQPYARCLLTLRGSDALTPLESALVVGSPAVIDRILQYHDRAVHDFVITNQFDFLRKSLEVRPLQMKQGSPRLLTLLADAAWTGNKSIMELLLDKGATVNTRCRALSHATPLCISASKGDLTMVKFLVERGADIELMSRELPEQGQFDLAREMLQPVPIQQFEREMQSHGREVSILTSGWSNRVKWAKVIWFAASHGYKDIVSFLIQHGADIETRDRYFGLTPFWRAAQQNHPEVMRVLIEGGANIRTNRFVGWGGWYTDHCRAAASSKKRKLVDRDDS